ncbi:hypothetical protein MMC11_004534 [Xylographa trunciseda]|nr:hypothetical protein [Xylographa trunciseda]
MEKWADEVVMPAWFGKSASGTQISWKEGEEAKVADPKVKAPDMADEYVAICHAVERPLRRPKSSNAILEYVTRIGDEMNQALSRVSSFLDKIWTTVKLPRDFASSKATRAAFFSDNAQLILARKYFRALQTLGTINESFQLILETWEKHQSAFSSTDRPPPLLPPPTNPEAESRRPNSHARSRRHARFHRDAGGEERSAAEPNRHAPRWG